jgi:hypothetical protein
MADQPMPREGLSRRRMLQASGLVATSGFVWAKPTVRSMRLRSASGTPPPTSTTDTTGPSGPTTHDIDGPLSGAATITGGGSPTLPIVLSILASGALGDLGTGTLDLEVPFPNSNIQDPFSGQFTLTFGSGSVSGTASGTATTFIGIGAQLDATLPITSGTGALSGAIGSLHAQVPIALPALTITNGSITGTITVP